MNKMSSIFSNNSTSISNYVFTDSDTYSFIPSPSVLSCQTLSTDEKIISLIHLIWTHDSSNETIETKKLISDFFSSIESIDSLTLPEQVFFHYLKGKFFSLIENDHWKAMEQYLISENKLFDPLCDSNCVCKFLKSCGSIQKSDIIDSHDYVFKVMELIIMNDIGVCYKEMGFYRIAIQSFYNVLERQKLIYETSDHPNIAYTLRHLAETIQKTGDVGYIFESIEIAKEALKVADNVYKDKQHQEYKIIFESLKNILESEMLNQRLE